MINNSSFKTMLEELKKMQTPVISITFLEAHLVADNWCMYHHIIVSESADRVLDFTFEQPSNNDTNHLIGVKTLDMTFGEAILTYSKKVIARPGAQLILHTM